MAKTAKQNRGKTIRRIKKGIAKASKRFVKNVKQLSARGRNILGRAKKMKIWGGMQYITGADRSNLIKIWDTFCQRRATKFTNIKKPSVPPIEYALFVIDMQNDFIDREYKRIYKEEEKDEKNMVDRFSLNGNFDVAQGVSMIQPLLDKLEAAKNDPLCKYIIFSRDYHPVKHSSFFYVNDEINMSNSTYGGSPTGNFPAHCVQEHNGSRLIPEIEKFILNSESSDKIKVIFKGIDPNVDSFTAVPMDTIDHIASNHKTVLTDICQPCEQGKTPRCCSSFTGGFCLTGQSCVEAMKFMGVIAPNDNSITKLTYDNNDKYINLDNVKKIEVCGLAGDYCVRDTIVALAKKHNDKEIVLLNNLTRYAFLPLFTIRTIPEHKADYLTEFNPNFGDIDETEITMYNKTNTDEHALSQGYEKDIKYYVFDSPLDGSSPRLMESDEVNLTQADFVFYPGLPKEQQGNILPLTRKHFITGHEEILSDYNNAGGDIRIEWGTVSENATNA